MKGFNYCMNCGFKLTPSDNFCPKCGVRIGDETGNFEWKLPYEIKINTLKEEYDSKVNNASELLKKEFNPYEKSYDKFISAINKSNNVFYHQLEIAKSMLELSSNNSSKIKNELDLKFKTLSDIIKKMDDLIDELIIHLSNKESEDEIKKLSEEMDDLINSVKDY